MISVSRNIRKTQTRRNQRGFSLADVTVATLVSSFALAGVASWELNDAYETNATQLASHHNQVVGAAAAFLNELRTNLAYGSGVNTMQGPQASASTRPAGSTKAWAVTVESLKDPSDLTMTRIYTTTDTYGMVTKTRADADYSVRPFLPPYFPDTNVFGQRTCALVIATGSSSNLRLDMLVFTLDGKEIPDKLLAYVARKAGNDSGFFTDSNTAKSASGSWTLNVGGEDFANQAQALCGVSGAATTSTFAQGHLATLLTLYADGSGSVKSVADSLTRQAATATLAGFDSGEMYRYAYTGYTGLQTMQTSLNMGGKSITNIANLVFSKSAAAALPAINSDLIAFQTLYTPSLIQTYTDSTTPLSARYLETYGKVNLSTGPLTIRDTMIVANSASLSPVLKIYAAPKERNTTCSSYGELAFEKTDAAEATAHNNSEAFPYLMNCITNLRTGSGLIWERAFTKNIFDDSIARTGSSELTMWMNQMSDTSGIISAGTLVYKRTGIDKGAAIISIGGTCPNGYLTTLLPTYLMPEYKDYRLPPPGDNDSRAYHVGMYGTTFDSVAATTLNTYAISGCYKTSTDTGSNQGASGALMVIGF